jgi:hypothetical protein
MDHIEIMCNTLEPELRSRCNMQDSGIKLQELQDLISYANFFIIIIISKIKKKSQLCNKEWPKLANAHAAMLGN